MSAAEVLVVGGGLVGAAIGYGLTRAGARVTMLDEGDVAFRAARGNFGNVWVQGKGLDHPHYAAMTREAALAWPSFAAELEEQSGVAVGFRQGGGAHLVFSEAELDARFATLAAAESSASIGIGLERLGPDALRKLFPQVGPAVAGATYCKLDGYADPLLLLRALTAAFRRFRGRHIPGQRVTTVSRDGSGFVATTSDGRHHGERLVVAAGLGSTTLAPQLGLAAPVSPVRGQILITEPMPKFMPFGIHFIRQLDDGRVICGESSEDVGLDDGTTPEVVAATARKLLAVFPFLRQTKLLRAWGALRIMSPDGEPLYQQSASHPGAYLASVHSGVTLAPSVAGPVAKGLLDGSFAALAAPYSPERFDA